MSFSNLLVESQDGITRITINRPQVLNALNAATISELDAAIAQLAADTRVVVLTGAGEKAFVAGADIAAMAELPAAEAARFSHLGHALAARMAELPVPIIAEVGGYALGGGLELMLACDFAIASENVRLGLPEVSLGVIPGFGGTILLQRRIGPARARQLLFTGAHIKADEALRIGLVNEVVPQAELRARVDAIARDIRKNAPQAVAFAKRSARIGGEAEFSIASAFEQEMFGMCFSTADQKEGMRAFLEKRKPTWSGR